jgi:hypothetical protein
MVIPQILPGIGRKPAYQSADSQFATNRWVASYSHSHYPYRLSVKEDILSSQGRQRISSRDQPGQCMLFNSTEFLFFFLPVVLAGFLFLQKVGNLRLILIWLVSCSMFFYGWWNPVYLLLLIFSACVNYFLGTLLAKGGKDQGRHWLVLGVLFNLGLLGYFKYANFFIDNFRVAMDWSFEFEKIILPLGISFFTFQKIAYPWIP